MFPLLTGITLEQPQVVAITRLMLHVAHVDGAKSAEEVALIRTFYEGCVEENGASASWLSFDVLEAQAASLNLVPSDFPQAEQSELAMAFCLMTAWADGAYSTAEDTAIKAIASGLGFSDVQREQVATQVKDQMLAQFARLPDTASLVKVAKELG